MIATHWAVQPDHPNKIRLQQALSIQKPHPMRAVTERLLSGADDRSWRARHRFMAMDAAAKAGQFQE